MQIDFLGYFTLVMMVLQCMLMLRDKRIQTIILGIIEIVLFIIYCSFSQLLDLLMPFLVIDLALILYSVFGIWLECRKSKK